MGLFDSIASEVLGSLSGVSAEHHAGLLEAVSGLLNNPQIGGLSGLVTLFEQQGLGGVIGSWIGTGQNQAISAQQIQSVLGDGHLQAIAQSLGLSSPDVASHLAQLLPQLIDKMTPNGQLPTGGAAGSALGGELGGLLGGLKGMLG